MSRQMRFVVDSLAQCEGGDFGNKVISLGVMEGINRVGEIIAKYPKDGAAIIRELQMVTDSAMAGINRVGR